MREIINCPKCNYRFDVIKNHECPYCGYKIIHAANTHTISEHDDMIIIAEMYDYKSVSVVEYSSRHNREVHRSIKVDKRDNKNLYLEVISELNGDEIERKTELESEHKPTTSRSEQISQINFNIRFYMMNFKNRERALTFHLGLQGNLSNPKWKLVPGKLKNHVIDFINRQNRTALFKEKYQAVKNNQKTILKNMYAVDEIVDFQNNSIIVIIEEQIIEEQICQKDYDFFKYQVIPEQESKI